MALVPLAIWFVISLIARADADHAAVVEWLSSPIVAGLMLLFVGATFYHMKLGLQVVIEDYVHNKWRHMILLIANAFGSIILALICAFAILRIALST